MSLTDDARARPTEAGGPASCERRQKGADTVSVHDPDPRAANGVAAKSPTRPPAIEIRGLRKVYGRHVALHDLSLTVQPGEVFGFLGPNGAGKTTTIKVLTGLVTATAGQATVFGVPVSDRKAREKIGYLPEHFRFHDWLTGAGLLDFHGRLAHLSAEQRRERIPEVLRMVGLAGRGGDRVRGYSKGMQQRLGLAQAILHRPAVVLLDEPSSALDPVGRREVRDLIRQLRTEGVTVFLNSHLLGEVETICDRVAIVDRGRVVREGTLDDVVGGLPEVRLTVDRADADLLAALARHGEILAVEAAPGGQTAVLLSIADLELVPGIARTVVQQGVALYGLVPARTSLEDVFVRLVEGREQ